MPDTVTPRIVVNANAGAIDSLQSIGRLLLIIAGTIPVLLKLLGTRDFVSLVQYFQSSDGLSFVAAVSAVVAFVYGVYKSHKRGAQIATAGLSNRVPDSIVTTTQKVAAANG